MDLPHWLQRGCRVEVVRFHVDSTNLECKHTTRFEPATVADIISKTSKV